MTVYFTQLKMDESSNGCMMMLAMLHESPENPFALLYLQSNWNGCLEWICNQNEGHHPWIMAMLDFILAKPYVQASICHTRNALLNAVRVDNCQMVTRLVKAGLNINDIYNRDNALVIAAKNGSIVMFNHVLDLGFDGTHDKWVLEELICQPDNIGNMTDRLKMIHLLLDRGCCFTSDSTSEINAFNWIIQNRYLPIHDRMAILKRIFATGMLNVNQWTENEHGATGTPLAFLNACGRHQTHWQEYRQIAMILLQNGATQPLQHPFIASNGPRPPYMEPLDENQLALFRRVQTLLVLSIPITLPRLRIRRQWNQDILRLLDRCLFSPVM